MTKTKPCDRSHASARLAIAENFIEAAELPEMLADDKNVYRGNAQVANYIQAGIAAADAICCIDLQEHSWGDNHASAVNLIKKVARDGPELAKALGTLLPLKTDASYGTGPMTDKVTRAQRAAEKLVRAARDRLAS